MAQCKSFLSQASLATTLKDSHVSKFQDLLPPRKRVLTGLKHISGFTESESQDGDAHLERPLTTAGQKLPTMGPPPYSLLYSESLKCFSCGDGGVLLHRVPYLSSDTLSNSYLCSLCVLSDDKHMYCNLCFQVVKEGSIQSSATDAYLTCCRCQNLTHLQCMLKVWSSSLDGAGLTLCKDCYTRNNGSSSQLREAASKRRKNTGIRRFEQSSVPHCKGKFPTIDEQTVIATKIVAAIAQRMAHEAKQRAKELAKAAVEAGKQAKIALDRAYEAGVGVEKQHTHTRLTITTSEHGVEMRGSAGMAKTPPKGSKRRALSEIVASEALARNLTNASSAGRTNKKRKPSDPAVPQTTPHNTLLASPSTLQSTRVRTKRRKTLTSLGLQDVTDKHTIATLKGSRPWSMEKKQSILSGKSKLGAIVSQVLARTKVLQSSSESSCKP